MRFLHFILCICLLLAPVPAMAKLFNAETFTLDNGLEVVVIPNHRAPVVTHMIWYKFGAADEAPGESGIAHFLEHLMFKGTEKVPGGDFSRTIKKLGGDDNAFTTHDYTAFYQNIARSHLDRVMEMEADRMKNLRLSDDQVLSERDVIIEERHQRIDNNPSALLQEQVMSALFVNHPYGTPVIGWLHEMQQLTREDALDYYDQWYAPNNAIVVIAGDITAAEAKPLAKKYYGAIPPQTIPDRIRPAPAPINVERRLILQDPRVGVPVVMKIFRAPRGSDALDILAEIFGGTTTARLYKDLVVTRRLAVSAGASYDPVSFNDTTFTVYASPTPGTTIVELEAALNDEIKALADKGVTGEEIQNAKSRKTASLTYYLDSLQGPAMVFGRALASGFTADYVETSASRIERLGVDAVNKSAAALFNGPNLPVTALLLPGQPQNGERKAK